MKVLLESAGEMVKDVVLVLSMLVICLRRLYNQIASTPVYRMSNLGGKDKTVG